MYLQLGRYDPKKPDTANKRYGEFLIHVLVKNTVEDGFSQEQGLVDFHDDVDCLGVSVLGTEQQIFEVHLVASFQCLSDPPDDTVIASDYCTAGCTEFLGQILEVPIIEDARQKHKAVQIT